jgi:tetratricopeptide (TPR) repeat protein
MKLRSVVIAAIVLASAMARADRTDKEKIADQQFAQGRKLMAAGRIAEACEHFRTSFEADPAIGTLLNLADCHDKLGKTATALGEFQSALDRAIAAHDDREGFARTRIAALEPKLSKLVIDAAKIPGLVIKRDGNEVELGREVPVDHGSYRIEATATGYEAWTTSIDVTEPGTKRVEVPALTPVPAPTPPIATTTPPPVVAAPIVSHDEPPPPSQRHRPIAAIGVTAAAAVCATVAILSELSSQSSYNTAKQATDQPSLDAAYDTANRRYKLAQGFGVAAVGLAAVSVYLWVSRGHDANATHVSGVVTPGLSALSVEGSF